jgi:predicted ArsR family transcriptional regulator
MAITNWNQRFFSSTRGRIVVLLRRASRTVDELAQALDLTDNAVRTHLTTLERDGIVQQRGERRSTSKPAHVYDLTPAAEQLFPKAYGLVLQRLLAVLAQKLEPAELETILRETGRTLAAQRDSTSSTLQQRLDVAVEALNEIGGMAELEQRETGYCIHSHACPLATAAQYHPAICQLVEAFIAEIVGVSVQNQCESGEIPRCQFRIAQV